MQRYTYHVGFKRGGEIEVLKLEELADYHRLSSLYGNNIRAIDLFTSMFSNETELSNYLDKKGLIKGAGHLVLLLRDHNSKASKVREVENGFLYRGANAFLNKDDIINFFRKNISSPVFISEAIKFFGVYFGSKNMPEINADASIEELEQASSKIHPLNTHLVTLDEYLRLLTFDYKTAKPSLVSKRLKDLNFASSKALMIMLDHIIHKKSKGEASPKEINYRGLRDAAIFCFNTNEKLKKTPSKVTEREDYDDPVDAFNAAYDEFLTPAEYYRAYPGVNPPLPPRK